MLFSTKLLINTNQQNLKKHCEAPEVKEAHEMMKDVARNIDQVKKKLEQKNRVKELSGILDGWLGPDLTVLGELRQEGMLMEHNKPRIVFLFESMLIITKPKEDKRLQFKNYIQVRKKEKEDFELGRLSDKFLLIYGNLIKI